MEEEMCTRLEDYLDNALDAAERAAFEMEVEANPALAEVLAQTQEARSRLTRQWAQESADQVLVGTLQQVGREYFKGNTANMSAVVHPRLRLRRWWPLIAAAACLTVVVIWFFRPAGDAKLYAQYRQFPESAFVTRAAGDPSQTTLAEADAAFNAGRYAEALALLQGHLIGHPDDLEKHFFVALCQLELGQTTEARTGFQQLRATPAYADEATWYLALTFLKEKNRAQCADLLRQIGPDSRHYAESQQLLKQF